MAKALVKTTDFENLVVNISSKSREDADFETTVVKPQREIIKAIISVYWFLRTQLKLDCRPITIDEFEITARQLREYAQLWVDNFWNSFFRPIRTSAWKHYLKFSYFPHHHTPFGSRKEWGISSLIFDCYWSSYPRDTDHVYERGISYSDFDPKSIMMRFESWFGYQKSCFNYHTLLVPPNIRELVEKIYEKRR